MVRLSVARRHAGKVVHVQQRGSLRNDLLAEAQSDYNHASMNAARNDVRKGRVFRYFPEVSVVGVAVLPVAVAALSSVVFSVVVLGCGGTGSETPWPVEPTSPAPGRPSEQDESLSPAVSPARAANTADPAPAEPSSADDELTE